VQGTRELGTYCGLYTQQSFEVSVRISSILTLQLSGYYLAKCDVISTEQENTPFEKYFIAPTHKNLKSRGCFVQIRNDIALNNSLVVWVTQTKIA